MAETFNKEKFLSPSSCLSLDVMMDYLHGKLDKSAMLQLEKHITDCELCSEAMEGLETEGNLESVPFLIGDMKDEFTSKNLSGNQSIESKGTIYYLYRLTAAAAILVIAVGGFFFIQKSMNKTSPDDLNNIYAQYYQPYPNVISTTLDRGSIVIDSSGAAFFDISQEEGKIPADGLVSANAENKETKNLKIVDEAAVESVKDMNGDDMTSVKKDAVKMDTAELVNANDNTVGVNSNTGTYNWTNSSIPASPNSQTGNDFTMSDKKGEEDLKGRYDITTAKKENLLTENYMVAEEQPTRAGYFVPQITSTQENEEILEHAMTKYDNNEHDSAIILFNEILTEEPNNVTVQFYQANSYLEEGDLQNGITNLNRVSQQRDNEYYEASQWYLALSYLKAGDKDSATRILNDLIFSEGVYKNRAEEVLKLLNK